MDLQVRQIVDQVGAAAAARAGAFSFVVGRGWRAHKDEGTARRAVNRELNAAVRRFGGCAPHYEVRGPLVPGSVPTRAEASMAALADD